MNNDELFTVEAELEATIDQKTGEVTLTRIEPDDPIDDETAEAMLKLLKAINEPTPLPPGTCECGSPMPCSR